MASRSKQIPREDFFLSKERNNYISSSQAAWSPSWLTPIESNNNNSHERELFRPERRALHMELPGHRPVTPLSLGTSAQNDYPFFFSDDAGSVQTGMSQQELLRKKARESKKQTKYGTKRKTNKPVVQITGFLTSRSPRNAAGSNLPYTMSRELASGNNGLATTRGGKPDRSEDIELSTAETTLTDSSYRAKNPPSSLRVVLDGGDLVLSARQGKLSNEFAKFDNGDEDDFPLLSRSASDSFQMDASSEKGAFAGRGYRLENPPSMARERLLRRKARSNNSFSLGESKMATRSSGLQSNHSLNYSASPEWILRSREDSFEKKNPNRSVRFRDDLVRPASFGSHHETPEGQNGDRKPKSILREPRYRTNGRSVLPNSSPSRFFIRKPITPEKSDGHLVKSSRSAHSPSGILDEIRRDYSPVLYDNQGASVQSDERYPDPPLDSVNIDDDDTTFASKNDAFLETIAAIVIQTAIRRFLATGYVDRLSERIANEMHAKYVQLYKNNNNEHQMQSRVDTVASPLPEPSKNRVPVERPRPQTSPSRPLTSPAHRTDRGRGLEEQPQMANDMHTLAAIRIQAAFRGFWARDSLDVDHFCATLIQRCVRRYLHEKKYRHGHYHVFRYVVQIQTMWRGFVARQNLHRSIGAAILIQAYSRGFIGRRLGRLKKSSRRGESTHRFTTEKSAIPHATVDSSWQKGLVNDLWQARKVRISDVDERKNPSPHPADYVNSSSAEQSRSLDFKAQRTGGRATREQFPSSHFSGAEGLSGKHHRPNTSRRENLSLVAIIKTSAAIKIQGRYRTYVCERKLIRSLVDILIVQTVVRRWLARRCAARLRALRDRCRTMVKDREPELNNHQGTTAPRLVSRSEFFQNRIVQPPDHPHFISTSNSGPSFDEDEFQPREKERRACSRKPTQHVEQASNDGYIQNQTYGHHRIANGPTPSSFQRTNGSSVGMRDSHVPTQPPQWTNMTLRPTKKSAPSTDRSEKRVPPQLTSSSKSESRVYSNPSFDSETRPTTSVTPASSARRQVVVTPPVLLKKNTDRQVVRR